MTVRVGRQLRLDEDIQGYGDDQLLSLVWMGLTILNHEGGKNENLRRRLELFRLEVERRSLLTDEMMQRFISRLARQ